MKSTILIFQAFLFFLISNTGFSQTKYCGTIDRVVDENGFTLIRESAVHQNEFISTRLVEYAIKNYTADLSQSAQKQAIQRAFSTWNKATGVGFREVSINNKPDLIIEFTSENVFGDNSDNVLAHAVHFEYDSYFGSLVQFNDDFTFTDNNWGNTNLETIALHEFGHILGLGHNEQYSSSIMYPTINGYRVNLSSYDLNVCDILFPGQYFSKRDNMRGFSWNKSTKNVSYIIWDYDTNSSKLILRKYNGTNFYGEIKIQTFSTADNIRAWSFDESDNVCSYIVYDDSKKKTQLKIRGFNGWNWNGDIKTITLGSADSFRGWTWDKSKNRASYLANDGISKTFLYIRSFDGKRLGSVEKKIEMSKRNNFRAWNWDMENYYSNYATYIRDGRNTISYSRSFNGTNFGDVD